MLNDSMEEVIFVGLPGPTHNYGGLSPDNIASSTHRGTVSRPREAAFQALSLVKLLKSLGLTVGILPPQLRPYLPLLRMQFSGDDETVIRTAARENPKLLEAATSSSAMWTANAATVTAPSDTADGKLHITPANLYTNLHRRIEAEDTYRVLAAIFKDVPDCIVHAPLANDFPDEGAANHMRLAPQQHAKGLNVFVHGGRQSKAASERVCADHQVKDALLVAQNPAVVAQGVFHNDVIAVSNESHLLVHEQAYVNGAADIEKIKNAYEKLHEKPLLARVIKENELSVKEAVDTYFFNSQIISAKGGMSVIAPMEMKIKHGGKAAALMESLDYDVHYLDLRQSMHNGGGPACLRLRVPMKTSQLQAVKTHTNVMLNDALVKSIGALIGQYYPDALAPSDIGNPELLRLCKRILSELSALLKLPL